MFLTEEEARKKWCPQARDLHESERTGMASANRCAKGIEDSGATGRAGFNCIASECMMWRRKTVTKHQGEYAWAKKASYESYSEDGEGYCGLGGKP